jgi:hypothetical protein
MASMRLLGAALLLALVYVPAGCSSNGASFSCLMGSGTSKICIDTTTNASGAPDCGAGTRVDSCPRVGTDGGCQHSFMSGGASLSQTIWYYTGDAAATSQEISDCTDNGGAWIQLQ